VEHAWSYAGGKQLEAPCGAEGARVKVGRNCDIGARMREDVNAAWRRKINGKRKPATSWFIDELLSVPNSKAVTTSA
jgi:hypothetical protein